MTLQSSNPGHFIICHDSKHVTTFYNKVHLNLGINWAHFGACWWLLELPWLQAMEYDEYQRNCNSKHCPAYGPLLHKRRISSNLDRFWTGMSLMLSYNSNTEFWVLKYTLESMMTDSCFHTHSAVRKINICAFNGGTLVAASDLSLLYSLFIQTCSQETSLKYELVDLRYLNLVLF